MKEIEFKARNKRTGEIVDAALNRDNYESGMLAICLDGDLIEAYKEGWDWNEDYQLVMYSGKKDDNGNKIYEDVAIKELDK